MPSLSSLRQMRTIHPSEIYGFPSRDATDITVRVHPDFRQPRIVPNNRIVQQVVADGKIFDPIHLYLHTDGSLIPVDGFSRLTGEAVLRAQDGDREEKVPFVLEQGDTNSIRLAMLMFNADGGQKTPLRPVEQAEYLVWLDSLGVTEEEQAKYIRKPGREGIQYIRAIKRVLNSGDAVTASLDSGDIELTTAKEIAKKVSDKTEQQKLIDEIKKLKASGLSEAEARKAVNLKKSNVGTRPFPETFDFFVSNFYKKCLEALTLVENPDWKAPLAKKGDYEKIAEVENFLCIYDMFLYFFKMDKKEVTEQIAFIESNLTNEQRELIDK